MSALQAALEEYLAARPALGHKLRLSGRLLQRFVVYAESSGATFIITEIALGHAAGRGTARPVGQPVGDGSPARALLQRH
ncbi:hypothetical protein NKI82_34525 [Mesorhizobium sp. M0482]|uniref:hypothetical protein n=1 Tax=Mesorhizobium sp. M0482 TaxID=2956948 RepID=UPI0033398DF1